MRIQMNKWGIFGAAFFVVSFLVQPLCAHLSNDKTNACLVPYILFQAAALSCAVLAAMRGAKAWLLISACSAVLLAQALLALFVE